MDRSWSLIYGSATSNLLGDLACDLFEILEDFDAGGVVQRGDENAEGIVAGHRRRRSEFKPDCLEGPQFVVAELFQIPIADRAVV